MFLFFFFLSSLRRRRAVRNSGSCAGPMLLESRSGDHDETAIMTGISFSS
jgi:hypothetical protein